MLKGLYYVGVAIVGYKVGTYVGGLLACSLEVTKESLKEVPEEETEEE